MCSHYPFEESVSKLAILLLFFNKLCLWYMIGIHMWCMLLSSWKLAHPTFSPFFFFFFHSDTLESREGTSPLNQVNLSRPQSFGPNFQSNVRASMYSAISDTPSKLNYQMSAANPFTKNAAAAAAAAAQGVSKHCQLHSFCSECLCSFPKIKNSRVWALFHLRNACICDYMKDLRSLNGFPFFITVHIFGLYYVRSL